MAQAVASVSTQEIEQPQTTQQVSYCPVPRNVSILHGVHVKLLMDLYYMQPQGVGVLSQNNLLASNNQVIKIKFRIKNYYMIGLYYICTFSVLYDL